MDKLRAFLLQAGYRVYTGISVFRPKSIKKAYLTFKEDGPAAFKRKLQARIRATLTNQHYRYQKYLRSIRPTPLQLAKQRRQTFPFEPVFGIVIPLYNTRPDYLHDLLGSFLDQTYSHFKLFLVDASPVEHGKTSITDLVQEYSQQDDRLVYTILGGNDGISANTNRGIDLAMKDREVTHIGLCDHDDFIEPDTLYEYAKALNEHPSIKIIYSDEDVVRFKGDKAAYFVCKPDFNLFQLESCNYINHFFVCEKSLLKKIKTKEGFYERPDFDGAQDYDLYLRLIPEVFKLDAEVLKDKDLRRQFKVRQALYSSSVVYHVPLPLYHWRAGDGSTAKDPKNKLYAFEAGKRALEEYFKAMHIPIESVSHTDTYGTYRVKYQPKKSPLVSIIIPNKDHVADLKKAISSIRAGSYQNFEFIIVENNSEDPDTFKYYDELKKDPKIKVLHYKGGFNYSAINNYGAKHAKGDLILLLNNDVEMTNPDSLAEMVAIAERPGVGVVGARLLYADGTIQHAGVVIGVGGSAGHVYYGDRPDFTYGNRANCTLCYSAVTGACLMLGKSTFDKVKGLNEELAVAFNDIDLCLKVRALGLMVVYSPYAQFNHYESKSRGLDVESEEKRLRMEKEAEILRSRWPDIMRQGDPYHGANFTLTEYNAKAT